LGLTLTARGHRVAVLAVDPSSTRSGGSILGDKTRMERLARAPGAFIRPSPSQAAPGGVARRTREAVRLVEAWGADVVLVETVGVGQSETMVAEITDVFVLLIAPGGGDELQGVKRGIMEMADLVLVNKADGVLQPQAVRTCADYAAGLRLLRPRPGDPPDWPQALTVSALTGAGLEAAWASVEALAAARVRSGSLEARRREQAVSWFRQLVEQGLIALVAGGGSHVAAWNDLCAAVAAGRLSPDAAAETLLARFGDGQGSSD
jgi:LAO/AO transport system kinase